jgi:uncharacterized membrane protein
MNIRRCWAVLTASILFTFVQCHAAAQTDGAISSNPKLRQVVIPGKPSSQVQRVPQVQAQEEPNVGASGPTGVFVTFDVPAACNPSCNGTYPAAINLEGTIAGGYFDASTTSHGFVRNFDGTVATFDVPGAGIGLYLGTSSAAINDFGTIAGSYFDTNSVSHGFLRINDCAFEHPRNCTISTFDPPGSVFTFATAINLAGAITGSYFDAGYVVHGFLRAPDGKFTTFDPPGGSQTSVTGINLEGVVAGSSYKLESGTYIYAGFLRAASSTFTTFDAATYSPCCIYTYPTGINDLGTIAGYDNDGFDLYHGFRRANGGAVTTFDAPGAGTGDFQGTLPQAINLLDVITGYYIDANGITHGFRRSSYGAIATFDPPNTANGSRALAINLEGMITGYYTDAKNVTHGFLRIGD